MSWLLAPPPQQAWAPWAPWAWIQAGGGGGGPEPLPARPSPAQGQGSPAGPQECAQTRGAGWPGGLAPACQLSPAPSTAPRWQGWPGKGPAQLASSSRPAGVGPLLSLAKPTRGWKGPGSWPGCPTPRCCLLQAPTPRCPGPRQTDRSEKWAGGRPREADPDTPPSPLLPGLLPQGRCWVS